MKIMKKYLLAIFFLLLTLHPMLAFCLSPWSTEELDDLEKEFIQLINQSPQVERNPIARQYINRLGKLLARQSKTNVPLFFLVKSQEINAFAGPGGYIGINTQLIIASENESELAAVMAHEIAHVRLHHLYNMIAHQKQMKAPMLAMLLASAALGVLNPTLGTGAFMASMSGLVQETINFTRSQEKAADRIGMQMLSQAGFDPRGMIGFFKKMQEHTRYYYTAHIPAILRSHPMTEDRIAEAEHRTQSYSGNGHISSMDYHLVKEILRVSTASDMHALDTFYARICPSRLKAGPCQYGQALTHIASNRFEKAKSILQILLAEDPDNILYHIPMAQTETGMQNHASATERLQNLIGKNQDNYALIIAYGESLMAARNHEKAVAVLLKGMRIHPKDTYLCHTLAQAQANAHRESYAYFTRADCLLMEGKLKPAIAQLKVAANLAKKDKYLSARIEAKIDEIKGRL